MIIDGDCSGIFWNILVGAESGRVCMIILTENTTISLLNNTGYGA